MFKVKMLIFVIRKLNVALTTVVDVDEVVRA